nr:PQQ-binding-like beta-propeller repeat protein [Streptomyces paludis]
MRAKSWRYTKLPGPDVAAAFSRDTAYIMSYEGQAAAVDTATGTRLWSVDTGFSIAGYPAVHNGRLYVVDTKGRLITLDTRDGTLLPRGPQHPGMGSKAPTPPPQFADGKVYVTTSTQLYSASLDGTEATGT